MIDDTEITGGPAYPAMEVRTHDTGDIVHNASQGATLLDKFAGDVLNGMMASRRGDNPSFRPDDDADWCYKVAGAMLLARRRHLEEQQQRNVRASSAMPGATVRERYIAWLERHQTSGTDYDTFDIWKGATEDSAVELADVRAKLAVAIELAELRLKLIDKLRASLEGRQAEIGALQLRIGELNASAVRSGA